MNGRVICGDSLDVFKTLPDCSVDAVVTDPPYGINLIPQRGLTKSIANDKREDARALWEAFVPEVHRIAKEDTAHLFFGRWSEVWAADILSKYFTLKDCIVWRKNQFGIGYYTRPQHEFIWYCHKNTPPLPQRATGNVWDCARESAPIHSCQKPIDLMRRALKFVLPNGGLVLDPFAGSGSTLVAAKREGYDFIGIEQEPEYIEMINARLANEVQPEFAF